RRIFFVTPPRGSGTGIDVWSVELGKPIGTLWKNSDQESMLRLVGNPARPRFAGLIEKLGANDSRRQRIAVFDSDTLEVVTEFEVQDVVDLLFSPDGKSLLVESQPNVPTNQTENAKSTDPQRETMVTLFHADSGRQLQKLNIAFTGDRTNAIGGRNTIVFRPDGQAIATLNTSGWSIDVWDLKTQTKVQAFKQTKQQQVQFAWSLDGDRLISMDAEGSTVAGGEMKVWDAARGNALLVHSFSFFRPLQIVRLPGENRVFAYGWGPQPTIWDGRPIVD
ncbi:MAG: WD40 repeat domain-containing protein, partial [Planctomycetales bacterium]|nr:WD40 repeat domain-containing protein [Planctomycetales bacterium]